MDLVIGYDKNDTVIMVAHIDNEKVDICVVGKASRGLLCLSLTSL